VSTRAQSSFLILNVERPVEKEMSVRENLILDTHEDILRWVVSCAFDSFSKRASSKMGEVSYAFIQRDNTEVVERLSKH
jgi:hypothetical protein